MKIGFYRRRSGDGEGGASTFQTTVLEELASRTELPFELAILSETGQPALKPRTGIELFVDPEKSSSRRASRAFRALRRANATRQAPLDAVIEAERIDVTWFLGSFQRTTFPKVITLFDLEHRFHPMFPEVSRYGWTWGQREEFYRESLPSSTFVVCGTEYGREKAIECYGLCPERVRVIPLPVPSFAVEESPVPELPPDIKSIGPYLFYPAQCWPHKNHIAILHALRRLDARGVIPLCAVFSGASKENRKYIEEQAASMGLSGRVVFLGICEEPLLRTLYRGACALVYPSFFGPDNLPPLEAFALDCPVIAAAVPGSSEQLGLAALTFEPASDEQLAEQIVRLLKEPSLRAELVRRGKERLVGRSAANYVDGLMRLVTELMPIFRCWDRDHPEQYRW